MTSYNIVLPTLAEILSQSEALKILNALYNKKQGAVKDNNIKIIGNILKIKSGIITIFYYKNIN